MNLAQRVVILIGLVVIVGLLLYPPWLAERVDAPGYSDIRIGRHLLFAPPSDIEGTPPEWRVQVKGVNLLELFGEAAIVALFTVVLVLALGRKKLHSTD
jgi:hypothetical protein